MITINGVSQNSAGLTLDDLLKNEGYEKPKIAVGLNGQVVPKTEYSAIILKDGDVVEVFHFMGGG